MLIGNFEAANFFQLSLRNYSIFPSLLELFRWIGSGKFT